jgi:hypothetical protein
VIKLGDGADRLPTAYGVAVLTRNAEATVGTTRIGGRLRLPAGRLTAGEHRKRDDQMQEECRSQGLPNPFEQDVDCKTETSAIVSKVM